VTAPVSPYRATCARLWLGPQLIRLISNPISLKRIVRVSSLTYRPANTTEASELDQLRALREVGRLTLAGQ